MDKNYIIRFLREDKNYLHEKYGVIKIGLFGSSARGDADENSDIDIAVEIDDNYKTLNNFLSLERHLSHSLHKKVDLGIESTFKPAVRKFIMKEIIHV